MYGIRQYFDGFVISEALGCRKPDPRMYAEGSRLLRLEPPECLFIDDDPQLVEAARQLGYQGITLDRAAPGAATGVIGSLNELLPIIEAGRTTGTTG